MVYSIEGNLYLQDGGQPPTMLTHKGDDLSPVLFPGDEKILFYRGKLPRQLYAIDFNGNNERAITSGSGLVELGYDSFTEPGDLEPVPGTRQALFNTRQFDPKKENPTGGPVVTKYNRDLLLANIDTGQVKQLLAPGKAGSFQVSPDGTKVAIQKKDRVDVIDLNGDPVRVGPVTYTPTQPYALAAFVFWAADSAALIVGLPVNPQYDMSGPATYAIWRYPVDGSPRQAIPLNPPPMGDAISVSPDGNWILYNHFSEDAYGALYLGDLRSYQTSQYAPFGSISENNTWSVNSETFLYGGLGNQLILGHIQGGPTPVNQGNKAVFLGWGDASHYLYFANRAVWMVAAGGETVPIFEQLPKGLIPGNPDRFTFIFLETGGRNSP